MGVGMHPGSRNWFSRRSLRWRFGMLAMLLALLFGAVAAFELWRERAGLERELREATQALRVGLTTTLEATEREMQHVAALMAADPEVQYFMRRAHEVVALEGGGAGGTMSAALRESLAQRMERRSEQLWLDEFRSRQIEFHLLPGAVNFLRLRDPQRFGDRLDEVRPLVASAHALDMPVSGFEVGRMHAGLRADHPVRLPGSLNGRSALIGSVEVGVALHDLLAQASVRFGAEFVTALPRELVDGVMWPDDVRAQLRWSENCDCYIDAPFNLSGASLLDHLPHPERTPHDAYRLEQLDGRWYAVTRVMLEDYRNPLAGGAEEQAAAAIHVFADRSELVAAYRAERIRALVSLLLGFVLVLGVSWVILRRIGATEEELESARRFRSALFKLSPDSVLVTDREGTIAEVNPRFCEVTGYAPHEVVGRNARILQSGNTPQETYRDLWSTLLAGEVWRGDLQNRRKDGSLYWEAHAVVPVRDSRGEITHFISFQRDISERHDMERALAASERLYRGIHDNVQEAIFLVRVEGDHFVYVGNNPRHVASTGLATERLRGSRPQDFLPPEVAEAVCANYRRCVTERQTIRYEEELELPAGVRHWMTSLAPVFDEDGRVEMIVGLSVDVSEQKRAEEELRRLATTDVLTGLANRRHFIDRATQELGRVRRYGESSALLMLDVDHFKRINDTWGHATGDAVLRRVAEVLSGAVRETDLVGRLGGEEFGVLLPQTALEPALNLAERLREAIVAAALEADGEALRFSASFGVTLLHGDDDSVDMPMARADAALYAAKFAGRNRVKWRVR